MKRLCKHVKPVLEIDRCSLSPTPAPRPTAWVAPQAGQGGAKHASRNPALAPVGEGNGSLPPPGPARRAQDATELRSRAKRGMGRRPTEGLGMRERRTHRKFVSRHHL